MSLNDADIQIGNLMGDFIKGNKFLLYPEKIKQGILLHRKIDFYTDQHPMIRLAIAFFKPSFRLSGGIFTDILFDHFLANDERYFSETNLASFTTDVYQNLQKNNAIFDEQMKQFFFYMSTYNWLYNYKYQEGLTKSILGICKRHPILGDGQIALDIIKLKYDELKSLYIDFFPQLMNYVIDIEK